MTTKIDRICRKKVQYRHLPIQEHLVYSHLICVHDCKCAYMHIYALYTEHIYIYMYNAVFGGYHPV